ncbi:MAG: glyoxalase/bleomycin resistance/extradiol dioxygenase family protein [Candidatus Dojkabacteria bacterium]|nr:MAG: glyoxalase/bleomycin resistance/extradiol dioxygenase family protein [Candidatus Dojkabacteria bacterium]
MKVSAIYVNLPIKDVNRSRAFWTKLGFSINEEFSDEKAICLVLNEEKGLFAMLVTHEFFKTFTNRPISDGITTQVINAIQVENRETVDKIVKHALEAGATRYREGKDEGWMYYDSFADLDGHQWEVMAMDVTKISPE